ncbi:MAG TPA: ATP-binding protein [Streptosporangiaceae bacterium]|nr:ATP-binding protein [Streptosporangiaceae bacterium]
MHTPPSVAAGPREMVTTYPGRPDQVRKVRSDLRPLLSGCPVADDVVLCVSELATNAVTHSNSSRPGGTFTIWAQIWPGEGFRVEVIDDGGPWLGPPPGLTHGRGLGIVAALAQDWGVITAPTARTVWAHLGWPGA